MELPPVILLRAFDAAGRHGSFKRAAAFLHVTPSTISHQIADLEYWLGVQLFVRGVRTLTLTTEGSALLQDVAAAFERLRSATSRLRQAGQPSSVRISANPFFANEILAPLVADFDGAFPAVTLHVSATEDLQDPRDGGVDFCVRSGATELSGLQRSVLFGLQVVAVQAASSGSAATSPRIDYPFQNHSAWSLWQQRGGPALPGSGAVRHFSSYDAAQRAAAHGLGVTLALWPLVQPWIRDGRLRLACEQRLEFGSLALLSRVLTPAERTLQAVHDWLVARFRAAVA